MPKSLKILFLTILIVGSAFQLALIAPSGLKLGGDLYFWGPHFHDTLWHVALARKLGQLSFENPVFSGENLQNYHYLMDAFLGFVYKVTRFPILDLTFRVFPLILSLGIGSLTFLFTARLFKSQTAAFWALFFTYFGSSFAFIFPFFGLGSSFWEGNLWVQQQISIFTNLPFAASLMVLLAGLYFLHDYLKRGKSKAFWLTVLFFGILPAVKSFSIVFLFSLLAVGLVRLVTKKNVDIFWLAAGALIVALVTLAPVLTTRAQFIFEPGWFLRTMMEATDRLNWQDWALKHQFYVQYNDVFNLARIYLIAFAIFLFGNLGTRISAVFTIPSLKDYLKDEVHLILILSALLSFAFPMFFVSSGIAWNSVQFFYYFIFIAGIYAGAGVSILLGEVKGKELKFILALVIVVATTPVNIHTLWFYYSRPAEVRIGEDELRALRFLAVNGQEEDRVLTLPLEQSTVYVSALTGKSLYLGDYHIAILGGHRYDERLKQAEAVFENNGLLEDFLSDKAISWVYVKGDVPKIVEENASMRPAYQSGETAIYHVEKQN